MVTYTPIPYWLSLPWVETCVWAFTVLQVLDENKDRQGGG
jgi:hypothetical protein